MGLFYLICVLFSFGCAEGMHKVSPRRDGDGMRTRRNSDTLRIAELIITSNVSLRFANVSVWSQLRNSASEDEQATFEVRIPKSAFITSFVLFIGDKTIRAVIKKKGKAHEEYQEALTDNITAGHVTKQTEVTDDFDRDVFKIAVNIAAQSSVGISLQYQELLERSAGQFIQKLYVNPGEVVPTLEVNCEYRELQNFKLFHYRTPNDDVMHQADEDETLNDGFHRKSFKWQPSEFAQEELLANAKPLEIEYDLIPLEKGGQLVYNRNGDFAQFFSPPCQEDSILAKHIVFVIDISGSMKGTPIKQVRTAMETILNQLRPKDLFNIVLFSVPIIKWRTSLVIASTSSIEQAQIFLDSNLKADGGTNINSALLATLDLFDKVRDQTNVFGQIVVLLTDGEASHGVTDRDSIRRSVRNVNHFGGIECCKTVINTIAFGESSDVRFLRTLSFENGGLLYTIKESSAASVDRDLVNFYDNMKNPLLRNVTFSFSSDGKRVGSPNVTQSEFVQFDCGSEIIVGGSTKPGARTEPRITAEGNTGKIEFDSIPSRQAQGVNADLLSRLVMYKKVRDILNQVETALNPTDRQKALDIAINISLQYQFVTPFTSLIVTVHTAPRKQFVSGDGKSMLPINPSTRDSGSGGGMFGATGMNIDAFPALSTPDEFVALSMENGAQRAMKGSVVLAVISAILHAF